MTESNIINDENTKDRALVSTFCNKDGLRIKSYSWIVKKALGIIILIHGLASHLRFGFLNKNAKIVSNDHAVLIDGDNYFLYEGSWVEKLNKSGYSVYGIDLQGHGESDGYQNLKLHIKDYDDYIYDLIDFIRRVKESSILESERTSNTLDNEKIETLENPPIYLAGFSMGANIMLRAMELLNNTNDDLITKGSIKGLISLSGMFSIKAVGSPDSFKYKYFFSPVMNLMSSIGPTDRISKSKKSYERCPYINDLISFDKVRYDGTITKNLAYGLMKSVDTLNKNMDGIPKDIPILFIHSKMDNICTYEDALLFFNKLNNTNKEIYTLENMSHVITLEKGNEKPLNKTIEWIQHTQDKEEEEKKKKRDKKKKK
ncbi:lysophospholipase, putative [Plasmodium reichenowi]|uniref:Lysophospholipase, putative n=1 Tax=Plasmodium reichenowi TaxID=5854 RepID=A0A060S146_PLARE|nr:lysophospholipase, putative [Plasmodium reichenowi]SOV83652.1 lysophospholipase, putative [Plasmodium reichenowi]